MEDDGFFLFLGSRLGEERVPHGNNGSAIPRSGGVDLIALGDIVACAVHLIEHMRNEHLALEITFVQNRIGAIVGNEPRQTFHVPSHILHGGEVQILPGTSSPIIVPREIDGLVIPFFDVAVFPCRSKGSES